MFYHFTTDVVSSLTRGPPNPVSGVLSCDAIELLHPLKTNSSPLKMVVSSRNLLFQGSIFRAMLVSGRVDTPRFCFDTSGKQRVLGPFVGSISLFEVPPWDDSKIKELEDVFTDLFFPLVWWEAPLCGWWIVKGIHQKMLEKFRF